MTKKQLIKALEGFPDDAEVEFESEESQGCCGQEICYCSTETKRRSISTADICKIDEQNRLMKKEKIILR